MREMSLQLETRPTIPIKIDPDQQDQDQICCHAEDRLQQTKKAISVHLATPEMTKIWAAIRNHLSRGLLANMYKNSSDEDRETHLPTHQSFLGWS